MSKKYCSQCGHELNKLDKFCPGCGTKLKEEIPKKENSVPIKDKISNGKTKINKKQAVIFGVAIIVGIFLIITLYGYLTTPSVNIDDLTVEKDDKKERNPDRLSQDPNSKYPYTQRRST